MTGRMHGAIRVWADKKEQTNTTSESASLQVARSCVVCRRKAIRIWRGEGEVLLIYFCEQSKPLQISKAVRVATILTIKTC